MRLCCGSLKEVNIQTHLITCGYYNLIHINLGKIMRSFQPTHSSVCPSIYPGAYHNPPPPPQPPVTIKSFQCVLDLLGGLSQLVKPVSVSHPVSKERPAGHSLERSWFLCLMFHLISKKDPHLSSKMFLSICLNSCKVFHTWHHFKPVYRCMSTQSAELLLETNPSFHHLNVGSAGLLLWCCYFQLCQPMCQRFCECGFSRPSENRTR